MQVCLLITETVQLLLLTYVYVLVYLGVNQLAKTVKIRRRFHYYDIWCESVPKCDKSCAATTVKLLSSETFLYCLQIDALLSDEGSSCTFKSLKLGALPGRKTPCSVAKFLINVTVRFKTACSNTFLGSRYVLDCLLRSAPYLLRWAFKFSNRDLPMQ